METSTQVIRGGPRLLAALALLAAIPSAHAGHATSSHRYAIHGSLESVATADKTSAANPSWLSGHGRLSPAPQDAGLVSGGQFVVMARLATSPLGCASDLIFANGFDPVM
jgi:hypothetical protein